MHSTSQDSTTHGGLAVVFVCFFVVGFLATILVQLLFDSPWRGSNNLSPDLPYFLAETKSEEIIEPMPLFSPEEVVKYQLEKLSTSRLATGIHQCFAFASPSNKRMTGPIARFARMIQSSPYSSLISPKELLIGKSEIDEDHASVTVTLLDSHGEVHAFKFLLTRQAKGQYSGCWMTESVLQLQRSDANESENIPTVSRPLLPSFRSRTFASGNSISVA